MTPIRPTAVKIEYPPLLAPGFHDIDESHLDELFVHPFPDSTGRRRLVEGLRTLLSVLQQVSITFEVWLDGSFTTSKPEPVDVDLVVFIDPEETEQLSATQEDILRQLSDNNDVRMKYNCDLYFSLSNDPARRSYWRGWFSFTRTEEPKGIARIFVKGF